MNINFSDLLRIEKRNKIIEDTFTFNNMMGIPSMEMKFKVLNDIGSSGEWLDSREVVYIRSNRSWRSMEIQGYNGDVQTVPNLEVRFENCNIGRLDLVKENSSNFFSCVIDTVKGSWLGVNASNIVYNYELVDRSNRGYIRISFLSSLDTYLYSVTTIKADVPIILYKVIADDEMKEWFRQKGMASDVYRVRIYGNGDAWASDNNKSKQLWNLTGKSSEVEELKKLLMEASIRKMFSLSKCEKITIGDKVYTR